MDIEIRFVKFKNKNLFRERAELFSKKNREGDHSLTSPPGLILSGHLVITCVIGYRVKTILLTFT